MSIHVVEMRALRLAHKRGEGPGPLCHPVHGHATKQRLARALEQRFGFGALIYKALLLALHEGLQAAAGNGVHERAEILTEPRDVWARATRPRYRSKHPSRYCGITPQPAIAPRILSQARPDRVFQHVPYLFPQALCASKHMVERLILPDASGSP